MFWAFDKELCINCEAVVFHTEITVTQYKHTYIKVCGRVVWLAIAYFLPIMITLRKYCGGQEVGIACQAHERRGYAHTRVQLHSASLTFPRRRLQPRPLP